MKLPSIVLLFAIAIPLSAQHLVPQKTFDAIATEFSGEAAQENDRAIVQYHRIQASPMMAEVAEKVVLQKLQAWGIEAKVEQFPADGKIAYSKTHVTPMGWDMRGGDLWVEAVAGETNFAPVRLCRYSDVPMCVSTYSKGGDWSGDLVEVGAGTKDKNYEGKNVRGKVALAYGYAAAVVREAALKHGAIGVVIYPPPGDRADHPDMVRYNGTWPTADEYDKTVGGFQISQNQYTQLQEWMKRGTVRVHGKIDATLGAGQLTLVNAWIRGTTNSQTEILISGHLDHPKWSANDNASGSATMMEMVRTLHALIAAGKLPAPAMTLHFLWVPEYEGTVAYLAKHPEIRSCNPNWDDPRPNASKSGPCVAMNLNLDMTGEDIVKTRSRFYFTRTPDSVGGPLNALMADVLGQTREANLYAPTGTKNFWPAEMTGYQQGSDHDMFLGLGIPSTMLGHDPDWTHHTSEDTPDKTDASEFRRVGTLAAAAAYWAASEGLKPDVEGTKALQEMETSDAIADCSRRISAVLTGPQSDASKKRLQTDMDRLDDLVAEQGHEAEGVIHGAAAPRDSFVSPRHAPGARPKRTAMIPYNELLPITTSLSEDDKAWWQAQDARFESDSPDGGLPLRAPFGVVMFETVNFMDGKRTTGEIADLLSAEFNYDIDQAWVDRMVGILGKLDLVSAK